MPESISHRIAVVTGGASGLGQAFARRLAQDGMDVVVADRAIADDTVKLIEETGQRGFATICDVSDPDSVADCAATIRNQFDRVDVLVNNAGIYPATPFLETEWDEWRRVMSINLDSLFHLGKQFLPGMVDRGWGRVISVSSTTFHAGIPNNTHYAASKGGVIGFCRSLAAEVGPHGITVNTIAPGLVRTATTEAGPQAQLFDRLAAQQAIHRVEEPCDLVGTLSFLASDDSAFITGQTLCVDGGWVRT